MPQISPMPWLIMILSMAVLMTVFFMMKNSNFSMSSNKNFTKKNFLSLKW